MIVVLHYAKRNKIESGYVLLYFMPALFGIILITTVCFCCIWRRRRNSSYVKLNDELYTTTHLVSPTATTTTTTAAVSSEPAKEPYNSATAVQVGDPNQPPTTNDPPMLQPMIYPVIENYGTTDNKS